ncbi:MAG TPA: hypothetical protein VK788_02885 [Terriglobales bacterium]|nr:hypothetical protein [Terriglobales bacterium]
MKLTREGRAMEHALLPCSENSMEVCVAGLERRATTDRFVVSSKERTSFMTDAALAADDLKRQLVIVDPDDPNVPHLGLVALRFSGSVS